VADPEVRRQRIKDAIADIAGRRNAVEFDEVNQIVNQIALLGEMRVVSRPTTHGFQYTVGTKIIRVKKSQRGQMRKCYVDDFVNAMIDLGLYEG
jgi:hypothetical protein